jgi:hypothetical protein
MRFLKWEIKASRWPWQEGYNWRGMTSSAAPLNAGGARFGGGWGYKLGIDIGGTTIMLNLLFGMVSINPRNKCKNCKKYILGKDSSWRHPDFHKDCVGENNEGT